MLTNESLGVFFFLCIARYFEIGCEDNLRETFGMQGMEGLFSGPMQFSATFTSTINNTTIITG